MQYDTDYAQCTVAMKLTIRATNSIICLNQNTP